MKIIDLLKKLTEVKKPRKFNKNKIYTCENCGYHQGVSWDGVMRNCKGCGRFEWE